MAFSKLAHRNTEDMTQSHAASVFQAEVSRLVREQGMSLSEAWAQVKSTEPELYDRIGQKDKATAASALGNATPVVTAPLSSKAFLLPRFHLPESTSDDVFTQAYAANGNQAARVDSQKIFMGLVAYTMKQKGVNVDAARRQIQEDFPALAAAAGQPFGLQA